MVDLIPFARTGEVEFLRSIFVRDQMAEWSQGSRSIMARADGVHYWDVDGKRYLDALSGIYVVSRRPQQPPRDRGDPQAARHAALLAADARHQPRRRATGQPARRARAGRPRRVKFQCGGSEVTEAAIKLARQYHRLTGNPGKYKIISRYLSWHGSTLGSLSASGLKCRKTVNEPLAPGFLHVFPPTCYRCPFGKTYPDCGITCATIVGDVIEMEDPATVAAIMVEPIGHTGGIIDPPPEYLPILREICDRHNILLIFDEIITGVGRTGHMFAAETFGVMPDVICTAQGPERRLRAAVGDDLPRADRRRLLGADRDEPRLRRGAHVRGQPDLLRRRHRRAARDPRARPVRQRPRARRAAARRLRASWRRSTASSATSAARGCSRAIEFVQGPGDEGAFPAELGFGVRVGRRALANGLLVPLRPALDRLRPGAGRRPPSRSTRWWRSSTAALGKRWPPIVSNNCFEQSFE